MCILLKIRRIQVEYNTLAHSVWICCYNFHCWISRSELMIRAHCTMCIVHSSLHISRQKLAPHALKLTLKAKIMTFQIKCNRKWTTPCTRSSCVIKIDIIYRPFARAFREKNFYLEVYALRVRLSAWGQCNYGLGFIVGALYSQACQFIFSAQSNYACRMVVRSVQIQCHTFDFNFDCCSVKLSKCTWAVIHCLAGVSERPRAHNAFIHEDDRTFINTWIELNKSPKCKTNGTSFFVSVLLRCWPIWSVMNGNWTVLIYLSFSLTLNKIRLINFH